MVYKCIKCGEKLYYSEEKLLCGNCDTVFDIVENIPVILNDEKEKNEQEKVSEKEHYREIYQHLKENRMSKF